jgi:hypothetical protein
VRGRLKVSIAVVLAALACAALAPLAPAAETPEEKDGVFLELTPRKHARVFIEIVPPLGVAVVHTEMGPRGIARPRHPWGSVDYAAHIPKGPLEGRLDVQIPGVLSVDGEVAPRPGVRSLEFNGSLRFTGKDGYLSITTDHAIGIPMSGTTANCPGDCRGPNPSLFDYIFRSLTFSNQNTQVLNSRLNVGGRLTYFQAAHGQDAKASVFKAQSLEWLPRDVAAVRTVEIVQRGEANFKVNSRSEFPRWATVRPPAPFSGSAVYRTYGNPRSPSWGKLTGSLSVEIFGVKVPLVGPRATSSLINLHPGF